MIVYNVTSKVDSSIEEQWLHWMKTKHIVDIMATKCFEKYQILKLIDTEDNDGVTYAIQYYALSKANINHYISLHAPALRAEVTRLWGNKFIAFRTIMEVVN